MTIRRSRETNAMIAMCEECGFIVDFEDGKSFDEAKLAIDSDGWLTFKENGKWKNVCCDCKEELRK